MNLSLKPIPFNKHRRVSSLAACIFELRVRESNWILLFSLTGAKTLLADFPCFAILFVMFPRICLAIEHCLYASSGLQTTVSYKIYRSSHQDPLFFLFHLQCRVPVNSADPFQLQYTGFP